jgi:hypothetical protein
MLLTASPRCAEGSDNARLRQKVTLYLLYLTLDAAVHKFEGKGMSLGRDARSSR